MDPAEPHTVIGARPAPHPLSRPAIVLLLGVVVGVLAALAFGIYRYVQPLPAITPVTSFPANVAGAPVPGAFPWPASGQAAIAVDGVGLVATHGLDAGPQPIASTTRSRPGKPALALRSLRRTPMRTATRSPRTSRQSTSKLVRRSPNGNCSKASSSHRRITSPRYSLPGMLVPKHNLSPP